MQEADTVAQLLHVLREGDSGEPQLPDTVRECPRRRLAAGARQRFLLEDDRPEPCHPARTHLPAGPIEEALLLGDDGVGHVPFDIASRDFRCSEHPLRPGSAGKIGNDEHSGRSKPFGLGDLGAASVRHDEAAAPAALQRDAVGKGVHQQGSRQNGLQTRLVRCAEFAGHSPRQTASGLGPVAALAPEPAQPLLDIDAVAAEALLGEHHREKAGLLRPPFLGGCDRHCRKPHRQRQIADPAALRRQRAAAVDRAELDEQAPRLAQGRLRRRIEEFQRRRVGHTPVGKIEEQSGEIAGKDLRRREGGERRRLSGMPQANRDTRLSPSGAPGALIGRGS